MKNLTLENDYLKVNISDFGAELTGLLDKRDGVEHMWDASPEFWPRHAPILFPCVGESKDEKINVNGVDHPMGRHGFARHAQFEVVEHGHTNVVLELKSNSKTRLHYPFEFVLRVSFELNGSCLEQAFEVANTDNKEIGFQLGGHPAFAVPFKKGEKYSDHEIRFDDPQTIERHLLTEKGLYSGESRGFLENKDAFRLQYELFNEDALVFKQIPSKRVWIQHRNGGKRLQVDYAQFPHLGIWSIPGADYVCIEPWIGCADSIDQQKDFFSKDSLIRLRPRETFKANFQVMVTD